MAQAVHIHLLTPRSSVAIFFYQMLQTFREISIYSFQYYQSLITVTDFYWAFICFPSVTCTSLD